MQSVSEAIVVAQLRTKKFQAGGCPHARQPVAPPKTKIEEKSGRILSRL
jgi:hypothetical protein